MAPFADSILDNFPHYRLPSHLTSWVKGVSPLSTDTQVTAALAAYLIVVFGAQAAMKNLPAKKLSFLFRTHNIILSSGSLVLVSLILEEILPIMWTRGIHDALCAAESWTHRLEFYYMINYYLKYLELLDTIFLVLKKKNLQFLHVFHHVTTAMICYIQLNGKPTISWVVITINLAVHVIMYYYFYATAGGAKFWWKKYLTTFQIVQFVIDASVLYFGAYEHIAATHFGNMLPHFGHCAGTAFSKLAGAVLVTIFLGLFVNFYVQTYKITSGSSQASSRTNAENSSNRAYDSEKTNGVIRRKL